MAFLSGLRPSLGGWISLFPLSPVVLSYSGGMELALRIEDDGVQRVSRDVAAMHLLAIAKAKDLQNI
jgi:hypothetical protein